MLISLRNLAFYHKPSPGVVVGHVFSECGNCCFSATKEGEIGFIVEFSGGGNPLPNWSESERKEIKRRIGLLTARLGENHFSDPESITFVV